MKKKWIYKCVIVCINRGLVVQNLRNRIVLCTLCIGKPSTACQSHMLFSRAGQSQSGCWVRNPRSWCTCACLWQSLFVPQMMNMYRASYITPKRKHILTQGIAVEELWGIWLLVIRFSWIIRCHYKAVFAGMLIQKQVLLSSCQRCFTTIHSIITGMASNQSTIAAIITIFISIYESVRSEFSLPERAHVLWQVAGFRSRWTTFMAWIFSTPTRIVVTVFRKQRGGPNVQAWKRHELSFKGQGC